MRLRKLFGNRFAILATGGVFALGLGVGGCNRGQSQAGKAPAGGGMPPALVTATPVVVADVPVYLDEIGKCSAIQTVSIKPQVSAAVEKIEFTDGTDVKRDQVLFRLDSRWYRATLNQAKAQLAQAQAQLSFAKVDFDRVKELPRSVEPQSDYDAKKSAIDVAQAQVEAAEAAIKAAEVNLDYCTIKSPLDGLAGQRMVDEGNVVIGNNPMGTQASLVTIQQMDPVYVDFTITENQLANVRKHMASGTLKTLARLPADKEPREGDLSFLDNAVQDGSGTVKLRATVKNKDRHFWPGQFVFVRLVLEVEKSAKLVPTAAIQVGQQGPFVYVITPDSHAELRPIVQGLPQGDMTVIQKGVDAGDKVIVTGQMMVFPGGAVREAQTPGGTGASPVVPAAGTSPASQPTTRQAATGEMSEPQPLGGHS